MLDALLAALEAEYKAAYERGDHEAAKKFSAAMREAQTKFAELAGLDVDNSPAAREMEKVGQGERLLLTEEWAAARDIYANIDRAELPEFNRPGVLNNFAYATAQAGDPEKGIALIEQAMAEAEALAPDYPKEKLTFMRGTHAIALSLAGRHEEAVALLETIIAIENPKRAQTIRAYYLGQSYRALGRHDDAKKMFELCASGDGQFAPRGRAKLEELAKS
jgi:tetratricopeptide (TPR) repeat protein